MPSKVETHALPPLPFPSCHSQPTLVSISQSHSSSSSVCARRSCRHSEERAEFDFQLEEEVDEHGATANRCLCSMSLLGNGYHDNHVNRDCAAASHIDDLFTLWSKYGRFCPPQKKKELTPLKKKDLTTAAVCAFVIKRNVHCPRRLL